MSDVEECLFYRFEESSAAGKNEEELLELLVSLLKEKIKSSIKSDGIVDRAWFDSLLCNKNISPALIRQATVITLVTLSNDEGEKDCYRDILINTKGEEREKLLLAYVAYVQSNNANAQHKYLWEVLETFGLNVLFKEITDIASTPAILSKVRKTFGIKGYAALNYLV